jgi:thiamine biosynthesis lipoprotein
LDLVASYPDCGAMIVDAQNKVWMSKSLEGKLQRTKAPTDAL